ncbi:HDOD domain-containing protein [Ectopseudomonas mendocina]|uniref:HDOD domain-containing protein n=1 Tax=Ectopseudomonas mendocina TaxID=300 RepID=A0ABZ2RG65_ECTME
MVVSVKSADVVIADTDPWTADLLVQLVRDVWPGARVEKFSDGQSVLTLCKRRLPKLIIADCDLPVLDGVELLRQVRRLAPATALPFVLISDRLDAQSVRAVRPLTPSAYLAKPFNAEMLRQRLSALVGPAKSKSAEPVNRAKSLQAHLEAARLGGQGAPLLSEVRDAVSQRLNGQNVDLRELEQMFIRDPQITARLIAAANSAAQHNGAPCQTLHQAIGRLGQARTLNLVLGMTLQRSARLSDPRLAELAQTVWQQAQDSAELANWLAEDQKLNTDLCFTAGLLHNIGELALLRSLQDWVDAGGELNEIDIQDSFTMRSASFGSALRMQWRLPLSLRELIAAFYQLSQGVFSREALVLNLTRLIMCTPADKPLTSLRDERCVRLLRMDVSVLGCVPRPSSVIC